LPNAKTESPAALRDRSAAARRLARVKKAEREARIVNLLNGGAAISEIAAREGLTEHSMRELVRTILKRRIPAAPAEFVATQVSRLHEALLVSYNAMSGANLKAVDRVVKIVRELDRYHGFAPPAAASKPRKLASRPPLALSGPESSGREMAPQPIEESRFAAPNGALQPALVEGREGAR